MAEDKRIISRIQQRKGLKADLPLPLRPGEFGFAVDSRQLYIGGDTTDPLADTFNRSLVFENTIGAKDRAEQLADIAVVRFTVPHIRFERGTFDGISRTVDWLPTGNSAPGSSLPVFSTEVTGGANASSAIRSMTTNQAFRATDLTVMKSGTLLEGDNSSPTTPSSNKDYVFESTVNAGNFHRITSRVPLEPSDSLTVAYYTAEDIADAIDSTVISPNSSLTGFYNTHPEIPEYRRLDPELITVSPTSGVGFVGFDAKQLAVYVGGNLPVDDPEDLSLGDLLCARLSDAVGADATANATAVAITVGPNNYDPSGDFPAVFVTTDSTSWLNNKLLEVSDVAGSTIIADLPVQDYATGREVTATQVSANVLSLTGNVSGVTTGDTVFFVNPGGNLENISSTVTGVSSIQNGVGSFLVPLNDVGNISSGLSYINRGNITALGSNTFVQVFSASHGYPEGAETSFLTPSAEDHTVVGPVTVNTFFIDAGSPVTDVTVGTMRPDVSGETYTDEEFDATPVRAIDLSSATTLVDAIATVNNVNDWPQLSLVPGSLDTVFFTHKNSFSSTGLEFRLFEDSLGTLGELRLTPGFAGFDTTVKAKFERWINNVVVDPDITLFTSAQSNQPYAASGVGNLGTWELEVDETVGELRFSSRHEAANFAKTLNRAYFQSSGADVRGLVTLKTNIELATRESVQIGTATTSYNSPRTAVIPASATPTVIDNFDVDIDVFNNFVVEYSVKSTGAVGDFYSRAGQLIVTADGRQNAGDGAVSLNDIATEVSEGFTGTVEFAAEIQSGAIVLSIDNTLDPGTAVRFSYIARRWKD